MCVEIAGLNEGFKPLPDSVLFISSSPVAEGLLYLSQFSNMLDCQAILSDNIITMIYRKNGLYGTSTNVKSQQLWPKTVGFSELTVDAEALRVFTMIDFFFFPSIFLFKGSNLMKALLFLFWVIYLWLRSRQNIFASFNSHILKEYQRTCDEACSCNEQKRRGYCRRVI